MKPTFSVIRNFIANSDSRHRPEAHVDEPMSAGEREQLASDIEQFLDDTCGPYHWDDLTSVSAKTTDRRAVLDYLISTSDLYPTNSGWCNDVGEQRLRDLVNLLRSDCSSPAIREFITEEYSKDG